MSLDVWLTLDGETVFEANITHNLGAMAKASSLYIALWHPEALGATKAKDISGIVDSGLNRLVMNPESMKEHDAPNGWGLYKNFLPWVAEYAEALRKFPESDLRVST